MEFTFEAIGTPWHIIIEKSLDLVDQQAIQKSIKSRIDRFDKHYSRFRADSLVADMARHKGSFAVPDDGYALLDFYQQLYNATDGRVTPLIGQTMSDAGYDADYSLRSRPLLQPPAWDEIISYDHQQITLAQPALLDFGAAGKGYLIDIIGELLTTAGIADFTIDAGGDILHKSNQSTPLLVGLENPFDDQQVLGVASVSNQSICGSAGNRRKWGDYTHIIDPIELQSPTDIAATWVLAESAMLADGLATALSFTKPAKLRQRFVFSYAILGNDMQLEYSPDFPAELYQA